MTMKKLVAFILAISLCLALVSCSGTGTVSGEKAILGEWQGLGGNTAVFNEDGTGNINGIEMTWKYDEELKSYTIAAMLTLSTSIKTEDGMEYITIGMANYYRPENMGKVLENAKASANAEVDGYLEGREKIEIGKTYDCGGGVTVKFTGAKLGHYASESLYLTAEFTADESVKEESIETNYGFAYKTHYIYDEYQTSWSSSQIRWGVNGAEGERDLDPGATVYSTGYVYSDHSSLLDGRMNRMVSCLEINGKGYYIDLTEYIQK